MPGADAQYGLVFGRTSDADARANQTTAGSLWERIARVLLTYCPRAIPDDALFIAAGVAGVA